MTITVKFFASLRERVGTGDATLEPGDQMTVAQVWQQTTNNATMPDNTLCAVDMEYVDINQPVTDGSEVAFFPPVTGG